MALEVIEFEAPDINLVLYDGQVKTSACEISLQVQDGLVQTEQTWSWSSDDES